MRAALIMEDAALAEAGAGKDKSKRILTVMNRVSEDAVKGVLNAAAARQYVAEIVKISTGEDLPAFTVRRWIDEWLTRKQDGGCVQSTMGRYHSTTALFCKWLGENADKPLEAITTVHIREFRTRIKGEGRASSTVNNIVKDINGVFIAAVNEGLLQHNPCAPLKPLEKDDSLSREPFTTEEVASLIEAAHSADWKGLVMMAAFTGLRLEDCKSITWGDVDLEKGFITVVPSKTKRRNRKVVIPIHEDLQSILQVHPKGASTESSVFPTLAEVRVGGSTGLSQTFTQTVMKAAGVSRGEVRKVEEGSAAGRTTYARGFHSLRHTFTSWLANSNVPSEIRMKLTGHTSAEVHDLYTHFDTPTLQDAIKGLNGLAESDQEEKVG